MVIGTTPLAGQNESLTPGGSWVRSGVLPSSSVAIELRTPTSLCMFVTGVSQSSVLMHHTFLSSVWFKAVSRIHLT